MSDFREQIKQKVAGFFQPTEQVRIRDVVRESGNIANAARRLLFPSRSEILEDIQKEKKQTLLPNVAMKSIQEREKENVQFRVEAVKSQNESESEFFNRFLQAKEIDPFLAGAVKRTPILVAKTLRDLASETSVEIIKKRLKMEAPELSDNLINKVTPRIAKARSPVQVAQEFAKVTQQNLGMTKSVTKQPISYKLGSLLQKEKSIVPIENATPKVNITADLLRKSVPEASDDLVVKYAKQIDEVKGQAEMNALVKEFKNEASAITAKLDTVVDDFKGLADELGVSEDLIQEARKYKSADEFVEKSGMVKNTYSNMDWRLKRDAFLEKYPNVLQKSPADMEWIEAEKVFVQGKLAQPTSDFQKALTEFKEVQKQFVIGDKEWGAAARKVDLLDKQADKEIGDLLYDAKKGDATAIRKLDEYRGSVSTKSQLTDIWNKSIAPEQSSQKISKAQQSFQQSTTPQQSRSATSASKAQKSAPAPSLDDTPSLPKTTIDDGVKSIEGTPAQKVNASPDDVKDIKDMIDRTQVSLRASSAVGDLTKRDLKKEVAELIKRQGKTIGDSEIRKIREENLLGAETIDEIILRKRGIITDEEAIERAKRMQGTLKDVLNIPKGTALNKEQLKQVGQIVQQEREINKKLIQLADGKGLPPTPEERALLSRLGDGMNKLTEHQIINRALEESTLKLRKAEIVLLAAKSEAGRALQGAKGIVDAVDSRMRIMYGKMRNLNELEQQAMIEQLGKIHLDDNKAFLKFLDEYSTADLFDKFAEWATAAKLWNPTTHIVNLGGNTLRQLTDIVITGATSPGTLKADIAGMRTGLGIGIRNALKAMTDDGYAATLSKYIEEGGTAPAIGGRLGKWIRTPFRMLGASDEIFRTIGYQRSLYRQAYRKARGDTAKMKEILERPTISMMEEATDQSKRLTFQEDLDDFTLAINRLRTPAHFKSKVAKGASTLLRLFIPFLKTPTNLFKQSLDFSPIGLLKNADEIKKLLNAGENEHAKRLLGEAVFGTALAAYTVSETLDGRITGGAPRDPSERDRFYRENKLPYAIKIGDSWYQYKRVDPFATVMASVADMTTLANKDGVSLGGLFGSVTDQLQDKTYLQGMSDLMSIFTGEDWEKDYAIKNMVLGASMPSFVGHIARTIDPKVRDAKTITDRIKSQIPFVSKSLPVKVNVLGADLERANKGLNFMFNPIQSEIAEIDPITNHLMEIDYTIPVPDSSFKRDKVDYKLTERQYSDYSKKVGTEIAKGIEDLMRKPSYKRLSDEKKIEKIKKLRTDIMDEWKDNFVKGSSGNYNDYRTRIISGINSGKITKEQGIELLKKAKAQTQ